MVKNIETSYKIFGEGRPFLILHGWGSNSDRWQNIAQALEQKYQVIVPDLPGFGKSQEPKTAWSLDTYVDWLHAFCEAIPSLQHSFSLLGHSFGGALAAKFAIKYNQRVEKLFLVSAACVRKRTNIKKVFYRLAKLTKAFSFLPLYPQFRKAVYKFVIRKSDYTYQQGVMKETYLRVILEDLSYKMIFVKVPTVIIWGEKDASTPIEQAKFIHEKVSGSSMVIIPEAGHALNVKNHETVAQKILEFM